MSDISTAQFLKEAFRLQSEKHYKQAIEALYKALCLEPENVEILSQISHLYFLMNNYERSFEYAEKILEIDSSHLDTLHTIVNICRQNKDFKRAVSLAERLFNASPSQDNFILYLELLSQSGEHEKLLALIEKAASRSTNERVLFLKAFSNLKLNNISAAVEILKEILRINPQSYDARFYLGVVYYNRSRFDEAEKIFKKILETTQCDRTYNYLGLISIENYKIADAINYFQFAAKIDPMNSLYQFNLGTAYSLNGWLFEAENAFKNAITLEPQNPVYHYSLAYLYYQKSDFSKALEKLEDTLALDSGFNDAIILKSLICAKNGEIVNSKNRLLALAETEKNNDFLYYAIAMIFKLIPLHRETINYLQQALFIKPESLEYLSELADCYCELQEYAVAQDIITKVLYLNNHFIYAQLLQAKLYLAQGAYSQALKIVQNAIKLDNSSAEAYKYQAMIFAKQGLKYKSIESAKIAVTLQPANKEYYVFLAGLYFDAQEYENAFLYYKEASLLDDANVDYLYKAAVSADKNNDFENAQAYFSYALRLDPFNNLIIYEYVDFLVRHKKIRQAMKLLKNKISNVQSKNIEKLLRQKYDDIKTKCRMGFWARLLRRITGDKNV